MGIKLAAASGGSVELVPTNTASNFTMTVPAVTATVLTDSSGVLNIGSGQVYKDASGNVGIGTSSPTAKLEVSSTASSGRILLNSIDLPMITNGFDKFTSGAYNGAGRWGMFMEPNQLTLGCATTGAFTFKHFNADSTSTERMRITVNGEVLVGTTAATSSRMYVTKTGQGDWNNRSITIEDTTSGSSQPGIGFHAAGNGAAGIFKMWGASGNFECRNGDDSGFRAILASAFTVSSDYRIKTDVVEVGSVLSNVLALRPVNYEKDGVNGREYGLIAHEAEEHFPDIVQGEKDAMRSDGSMDLQTVNYMSLTSILVKAIQEQQAQIVSLQDTVTSQAEALASLTTRLAALEAK